MKKVAVAVSAALLVTLLSTSSSHADPRFHRRATGGHFAGGQFAGTQFSGGHSFHGQLHGRSFHGHGFHQNRFFPGFVPFGGVGVGPIVVYSPPGFSDPPVYFSAPVPYSPPAPYVPPVSPPVLYGPTGGQISVGSPMPRVVEFATGRYELRGDGINVPHTWVWVPNPPTAPPAAAPMSGDTPQPARRAQVFRWVDDQGVIHWTDRAENVPAQKASATEKPSR